MEEEKSNLNKKGNKKIYIIIAILVILLVICAIFLPNFIQRIKLISEVNKIVENKNLSVDTIDVNDIKTTGEYGKVETAIKTYLNDYATGIQEIIEISNDEKISGLLSIDNFKNDGPEFNDTLTYVTEKSNKLKEISEKTLKLMEKEQMINYIDNYDVSDKYKDLYEELMLDEVSEDEMEQTKNQLQNSIDKLLSNLQVAQDTLNFLKENKSGWSVQNSKISFNSKTLLDKYNELTSKIQR